MDLKQIKELMAAMEKAGMKRIKIKQEKGFELELERPDSSAATAPTTYPAAPHRYEPVPAPSHHVSAVRHEEIKADIHKEASGKFITSPMVGTYYSSPSPDDPAFIKVGDRVEEDTIVCIIEAMKVMNEVKAGMKGVIAEIVIENAHPVEFGTKILRIV
jgi:acetyl-CoA carboxylase biotin carboxyl carrier protein